MKFHIRLGCIVAIISAVGVGSVYAAPIATLVDLDSSASFDLGDDTGMFTWTIGDVEHIARQWFWYRVGDAGPESPIHALGGIFHGTTDANWDGNPETLYVRYQDNRLKAEITFVLTGAGPNNPVSDIAESIRLTNLTASPLDLHFYQLCDFDLGGTQVDQSVSITGGNSAQQTDLGYYASEAVVTPRPDHFQVDFAPNILSSLNDAAPTTLNDFGGPLGPGDLSWAFQWDATLGAIGSSSSTMLISKDKMIVPEPATMALLSLGGLALLRRRKK
jgi:large repetitive protein